jgi:hypothetical protein
MQKTDLNIRASYKRYKQTSTNPVDIKEFTPIANSFMQFLASKVQEGQEIVLPAKLGTLSVLGKKKQITFDEKGLPKLPPNWKKTKELWERNAEAKAIKKLVYCTNEATSGIVYRVHWSKNRVPIENKTLYSLRMTRENKRSIHKNILQGVEYLIKEL